MKTTLCLLISCILLINCSNAQSFGITAGPNFAFYEIGSGNLSVTSDIKTGFAGGFVASLPVSKYFSFRPELKYVQKGGKLSQDGYSNKLNLNYIELPVNFVFNTHSSRGMFFVGLGPSFNMGLSGTSKGDDGDYKVKFGSTSDDDFKPFEIGLNALIGYQFKGGFFVSANSNGGLNNIGNDFSYDAEYHNWYFGINVGFMFKGKSKPAAPAATN